MKHSGFGLVSALLLYAALIIFCIQAATWTFNGWGLIALAMFGAFWWLTYKDGKAAHAEMVRQLAEERL